MGCVSSKSPVTTEDGARMPMERIPSKRLSQKSSKRVGNFLVINRSNSNTFLMDVKSTNASIRLCDDRSEKSRVKSEDALANFPSVHVIPKGREGELVGLLGLLLLLGKLSTIGFHDMQTVLRDWVNFLDKAFCL